MRFYKVYCTAGTKDLIAVVMGDNQLDAIEAFRQQVPNIPDNVAIYAHLISKEIPNIPTVLYFHRG